MTLSNLPHKNSFWQWAQLNFKQIVNLIHIEFASSLTIWKASVFEDLLVRIFPHSDWIRRNTGDLRISPYSGRMRENTDRENSEYGIFSRSTCFTNACNHRIQQLNDVFRISSNTEEVLGRTILNTQSSHVFVLVFSWKLSKSSVPVHFMKTKYWSSKFILLIASSYVLKKRMLLQHSVSLVFVASLDLHQLCVIVF